MNNYKWPLGKRKALPPKEAKYGTVQITEIGEPITDPIRIRLKAKYLQGRLSRYKSSDGPECSYTPGKQKPYNQKINSRIRKRYER